MIPLHYDWLFVLSLIFNAYYIQVILTAVVHTHDGIQKVNNVSVSCFFHCSIDMHICTMKLSVPISKYFFCCVNIFFLRKEIRSKTPE